MQRCENPFRGKFTVSVAGSSDGRGRDGTGTVPSDGQRWDFRQTRSSGTLFEGVLVRSTADGTRTATYSYLPQQGIVYITANKENPPVTEKYRVEITENGNLRLLTDNHCTELSDL